MAERVPSECTLLVPLGFRGSLPLNLVDQVDVGEEMLAAAEHINAELLEDLALLRGRNRGAVNVDRSRGSGCGRGRFPFKFFDTALIEAPYVG